MWHNEHQARGADRTTGAPASHTSPLCFLSVGHRDLFRLNPWPDRAPEHLRRKHPGQHIGFPSGRRSAPPSLWLNLEETLCPPLRPPATALWWLQLAMPRFFQSQSQPQGPPPA